MYNGLYTVIVQARTTSLPFFPEGSVCYLPSAQHHPLLVTHRGEFYLRQDGGCVHASK